MARQWTGRSPFSRQRAQRRQITGADAQRGKAGAVAGLAQNFAALRSLTTTGIQKGHMKMHLMNILNQLKASPDEKEQLIEHFKTHVATHSAVVEAFQNLRR